MPRQAKKQTTIEDTPTEDTKLAVVDPPQPPVVAGTQADRLIEMALDRNVSVETVEKLVALSERMAERAARSEFVRDLAGFQSECGPVFKSQQGHGYTYAPLDVIADTIRPYLTQYGFSYSWDSLPPSDGFLHTVCVLRHVGGHSEQARFSCPIMEGTSRMNATQKAAGTLTYAKRQSLTSVLGLSTTDKDTDARMPIPKDEPTISDDQCLQLEAKAEEVGADWDRYLAHIGVEDIRQLPARRFDFAMTKLIAKAKQNGGTK